MAGDRISGYLRLTFGICAGNFNVGTKVRIFFELYAAIYTYGSEIREFGY